MIVDVAGEVLALAKLYLRKVKRAGADNISAICPFHRKPDGSEERSPSFYMSLSRGLYFCHACESSGNLKTFLRDIGADRGTIDRYLPVIEGAAKNIPPLSDPTKPLAYELPAIDESVLGLLDYCPVHLTRDGFTERTLRHFDIGYDYWHLRTTFPLRDIKGALIGISGRAAEKVHPRYKVYTTEYTRWGLPAVMEPDRRAIMWNADKVYPSVYFSSPQNAQVVVVEGFKACMWVWQAGIPNVVALLGTHVSREHIWILERLGATVLLFLDNNRPGRIGTIKGAEKLTKSLNVRVVRYPPRLEQDEDAQPDSCTAEEVIEQVGSAPDYLNWLLSYISLNGD